MSKLACLCGNLISNNTCPSPTEGWLTTDQDRENAQPETTVAVKAFLAALVGGRREEFIRSYFLPGYPADLADESVLFDVQWAFDDGHRKSVAECDQCGRLWIQVEPGENVYRSYAPDKGSYAGILRGAPRVKDPPEAV